MSDADKQPKQSKQQFTIINNDSTDGHGGYGVGTLSLSNVSPVIVDVAQQQAYVDMGAMHAKSEVEKRIKFLKDKSDVSEGKLFWLVWVTIDHKEQGAYYAGVAASEMIIDHNIRRGYKNLADHVNKMDRSMKRKVLVEEMDETSKRLLQQFLQEHDQQMWENSTEELKTALS